MGGRVRLTQNDQGREAIKWLCASLCVLGSFALLWSAPAFATKVHVYTSSFGSEGSGPGQFNEPLGVAVNDATHDVYVVDKSNDRVEYFDATGTKLEGEFNGSTAPAGSFSSPTEIAIDNSGNRGLDPSNEDVYVVDSEHGVIDKFTASGVYQGQLTGSGVPEGAFEPGTEKERSVVGVAVDAKGTVWVSTSKGPIYSFSDELVNKYLPPPRSTAFGGAGEGLGVDNEDNLYIKVGGSFAKINSAGETLLSPFGGDENAWQVAVDTTGNEVYLDSRTSIEAFTLSGTLLESFGSESPTFEGLTSSKGVAVDTSDGTVYASERVPDKVAVFDAVPLPTVTVAPLSEQLPRSVTLNGAVTTESGSVSSCVFEYGTAEEYENNKTYAHSVACSPTNVGSVSAHLTGLAPGTKYDYRLVAENEVHLSNASPNQEFFTGPLLSNEFVTDVTSSSAILHAEVDPNGGDTRYYIQYGKSNAYGSYAPVSLPGVDLGSAAGVQSIGVHLQGLEAGVTYHYRFVVEQGGELLTEPDRGFVTLGPGALAGPPDGRAWELVSPANKKGALIELFEEGQVQAASDGSGITYLTEGASLSEGATGKITHSQVLSRRGPEGWGSVDLTLPGDLPENGESSTDINNADLEYHLFSPNLLFADVEPQQAGTPLLSPEAKERTLYLRNNLDENFMPLVTASNAVGAVEETNFNGGSVAAGAASEFQIHFLAATPDLSHVLFKTPKALTSEAIDEESVQTKTAGSVQWNLYEWSEGRLQLVNILPNGEVAHGPISRVPGVRLAGMTNADGLPRGGAARVVSDDGRTVAWTWGEPYTSVTLEQYRGLYVRDMVEKRTVRVGGTDAVYQTMNSDGSKVFFRENGDLYVFDIATGAQTDLTATTVPGEAGVQEVVSDVSEDGSYVYFVATGVLAEGAESGQNNLYVLHDTGSGWTTAFIAALSPHDRPSWFTIGDGGAPYLAHMSSRVSPDGRYLAFMSDRSLTGYDNTNAVGGAADEEVFLYDAETKGLVCASCDPTGARPTGIYDAYQSELLVDRPEAWTEKESTGNDERYNHWLAGSIPGWDDTEAEPATYQPRYLSDSGRLFFDSPVGLVPQDTNGLEDVYEFEPEGVGNCLSSVSSGMDVFVKELAGSPVDGCVGLVSSGTSSTESAFYDASENGDDAFFTTAGKLVGEDYDKGYDVYDAHVCTSTVPCKTVPVSPPACTSGDSCKASPSPQPAIFGAAPTATFNGAGNIIPAAVKVVKKRALTNAQKLAAALRACHKKKGRNARAACERQAHKRYPIKHAHKSATESGRVR